jgi:hypothetical protein
VHLALISTFAGLLEQRFGKEAIEFSGVGITGGVAFHKHHLVGPQAREAAKDVLNVDSLGYKTPDGVEITYRLLRP